MDEGEVKPSQKYGPACFLAVQILGCLEVCEVPVVVQDLYHVSGSFQDVPPFFQALDD